MNVTRENIDDLNAILRVEVEKSDYESNVEKVLRDYRKKANIKGFRPGMVPIGLIKKMYGKAVRIDEINKIVAENISKYLSDEKIDILGDPLPRSEDNEKIDLDNQDSFTFSFDLGLAPDFEIKLTNRTKVPYYEIEVDDKMKNDYLASYTRRYGKFEKVDLSEEKDMLKGKIEAIGQDGNISEDGPIADDTSLSIDIIKDDDIKKQFIGRKVDESVDFDLRKAFPNDNEIAGLLKKEKEEVTELNGNYRFTISEINRFRNADLNQELFDRIYGEDVISSEEEFHNKLEEEITVNLKQESDYKLSLDLRKVATETSEFILPEDFLRRWLLKVNEKTTQEEIEKGFDSFKDDLKWQLIRNKIAKMNEIKISEEELQKEAENVTRYQFRQYGLFYATDEQVSNYAKETLKREDEAKRIADKILEDKVINHLKEMVKIDSKKISIDEFNKLFE
jgi:trigger factor